MPTQKKQTELVDYNIEYAHIYLNESFSNEHEYSVRLLKKIIRKINREGKTYNLTVLLDDYNPSESLLDVNDFISQLTRLNATPCYVGFESKLVPITDFLLEKMSGKIKKRYTRYIEKNGRVPCSFLVAAWHLLRLGVVKNHRRYFKPTSEVLRGRRATNLTNPVNNKNKPFIANKIITILPSRYKTVEEKAIEVIRSTEYKESLKRFTYKFF